jgi:hypothetical protein
MPKVDIDYSNTIFYKISCKDDRISDVYIGHTTNFVQRKSGHKQCCNNSKSANYSCKLYEFIRQNGGWNNWRMDIIEHHECKDHYEARKKEQELFILHKATLNSIEPMPKPKSKIARPTVHTNDVKSTHTCETCNFSCFNTLEVFTQHLSRNKHIKAASMAIQDAKHHCECCKYYTVRNSQYARHLLSSKHIRLTNADENSQCKTNVYRCTCGHEYKHASSLCKHKHVCKGVLPCINGETEINSHDDNLSVSFKDTIMNELLKQNQDLKTFIIEQNKFMMELVNKSNITSTTV